MTTALATLIRLRPAPELEPPFDDDEERARHPVGPPLSEADFAAEPLAWPTGQPWPDATGATGTASDARLAARRYLALCVEILGGFRPLAHLRLLTSATAYGRIAAQLTGVGSTGRVAGLPPPWPGVTTGRLTPAPGDQVVLRHLRVCEPLNGIAEVAAVLGRASQVWAMALRLERHHGGWLCHHLEVL